MGRSAGQRLVALGVLQLLIGGRVTCVAAHLHLNVRGEVHLGIRGEGNSRLRRDGAATVSRYRRVPVVEVAGVVKDVDETANELLELNDTASQLRVLALKLSNVQAHRDNGYGVGMGGPGRGGVRDDGGGRTRCRLTSRGLEEVLKLGDALLEGRLMVLFCVTRALCGLAVTCEKEADGEGWKGRDGQREGIQSKHERALATEEGREETTNNSCLSPWLRRSSRYSRRTRARRRDSDLMINSDKGVK